MFKCRFIDDLLLIIDITDFNVDIDKWLQNIFNHNFLKFSYEFSHKCVSFLDMNIMLDENNVISTSLFRKPMSKHEFVHYNSSHPSHLLKSLPYSCGLRIIRTCSEEDNRNYEMRNLMEKFQTRGYPKSIIDRATEKLMLIDRNELLRPKSKILRTFLSFHNPDILQKYIFSNTTTTSTKSRSFIIMPFYKNVNNLSSIVKTYFMNELQKCEDIEMKACIEKLDIIVAFSISNSVQRYIDILTKRKV